ncbi:MAG: DUF1801 domain-containing protein [Clostridiaceae bacterium]
MNPDIASYTASLTKHDRQICQVLMDAIEQRLPQAVSKVWHGSPAWFIDGNPIVGYCKLKTHVQLLFWSGQSFDEAGLTPVGKFKAAEARYTDAAEIDPVSLAIWLDEAERIQWDYKNIVKRRGELIRLK